MKFSKYNICVKKNDALIVYNSKNASYVKITKVEDIKLFKELESKNFNNDDIMVQALYKRGFIVDDNCDEYLETKNSINDYFRSRESRFYFMIYVTEHCNFRCIYCPQKHKPQILSQDNWSSLYTYIEKQIKNGKLKELNISFFGGEPLLEIKNIYKFLDKLELIKQHYPDIIMQHDMTTNGYLLKPEVYDKLVKYSLKGFQITIDGFKETHDKMRPRVDGIGTWDTIIKNLEYINTKKDGTKIILRMNYNQINKNSIQEFYEFVNNKFSNEKFLYDIQPVTDFSENVDMSLVDNSLETEKEHLQNRINKFEKSKDNNLNPLRKLSSICKCAYKNNYTITSGGLVTKCEQAYDEISCVIGKLDKNQGIIFNENISDWTQNFELEDCADCVLYPLCAGRSCPARKVFDSENRSDCTKKERDVKQAIISVIKGL